MYFCVPTFQQLIFKCCLHSLILMFTYTINTDDQFPLESIKLDRYMVTIVKKGLLGLYILILSVFSVCTCVL